jgi:hypothetical protein
MLSKEAKIAESARNFALQKTWAFAREVSPFYRDWLPDLSDRIVDFEMLRALPILSKDQLAQNRLEIYGNRPLPAGMIFTGGTTGRSHLVFVTSDELKLRAAIAVDQDVAERPLTLATDGGSQGRLPTDLDEQGVICVPLRSRSGYEWAWQMLVGEHKFPGLQPKITQLVLPLPAIKKLVNFMTERKLDAGDISLRTTMSYSSYLSRGWRRRIEYTLRTTMVDCYGFTEAPVARALQCSGCGCYHMPDSLIVEYLKLDSADLVVSGIGRLCITTLYPQTQGMILFRYDPGDIIEVGPPCTRTGTSGFRPKGRVRHAARINIGEKPLYPVLATDVQEALDIHHWVARSTNLRHSGVTRSEADSWPKWRLKTNQASGLPQVLLEVELTSSPAFFQDEWFATRDSFYRTILGENAILRSLIHDGLVQFSIDGLPPGSIDESEVIRC